jgi:hypothetical protein
LTVFFLRGLKQADKPKIYLDGGWDDIYKSINNTNVESKEGDQKIVDDEYNTNHQYDGIAMEKLSNLAIESIKVN